MNSYRIVEIINDYKRYFKNIHNEEIYKWRAVKCFQNNWNIDAPDFLPMLDKSFALAKNLLDSGLYFPKQMLLQYTEREPEKVRQLFIDLYNEDNDLIARIETFQDDIKSIHNKYFSWFNPL